MKKGPTITYTCAGCEYFVGINHHVGCMLGYYISKHLETPSECKLLLNEIRKDKLIRIGFLLS